MTLAKPAWQVRCEMCHAVADPETRKIRHRVITPTPDVEQLEEWMNEDGGCEATDGCWVEPDGICEHGHQSWLRRLGMI